MPIAEHCDAVVREGVHNWELEKLAEIVRLLADAVGQPFIDELAAALVADAKELEGRCR